MSQSLQVKGMTCANCAAGIEKHLKNLGYDQAKVSFAHQRVAVPEENEARLDRIAAEIRSLGYQVSGLPGEEEALELFQSLEFKLVFCSVFTLPLLLHMLFHASFLGNPFVQRALCIPVFAVWKLALFIFSKPSFAVRSRAYA